MITGAGRRLVSSVTGLSGRRKAAIAAACALVLLTGVSLRLLVFPAGDPAGPTDAVVLLAGAPETRLPVAIERARTGPGVLVISAAGGDVNAPARKLCDSPPGGLTVYCFAADPPQNTRSEARAIGALVSVHGWHRITVVTSSYHLARAGLLIRRCTRAEVTMLEARPVISGWEWGKYVAAELGGLAVAVVATSC